MLFKNGFLLYCDVCGKGCSDGNYLEGFQSSNSPVYIQTSGAGHQDHKSLEAGVMKALGASNILHPPNTSQASLAGTNLYDGCVQQRN